MRTENHQSAVALYFQYHILIIIKVLLVSGLIVGNDLNAQSFQNREGEIQMSVLLKEGPHSAQLLGWNGRQGLSMQEYGPGVCQPFSRKDP